MLLTVPSPEYPYAKAALDFAAENASSEGGEPIIAMLQDPTDGAINGYVKLPENHRWLEYAKHSLGYDDIMHEIDYHANKLEGLPELIAELEGGARELTFSYDGWIGFDTKRMFDTWGDKTQIAGIPTTHWTKNKVYQQLQVWQKIVKVTGTKEGLNE